jgi:hypothetical protein
MERELIGILSVIVMVVLLLARMPVAFVMLVLGMAGIGWIKGSAAALGAASSIMYGILDYVRDICQLCSGGCSPFHLDGLHRLPLRHQRAPVRRRIQTGGWLPP